MSADIERSLRSEHPRKIFGNSPRQCIGQFEVAVAANGHLSRRRLTGGDAARGQPVQLASPASCGREINPGSLFNWACQDQLAALQSQAVTLRRPARIRETCSVSGGHNEKLQTIRFVSFRVFGKYRPSVPLCASYLACIMNSWFSVSLMLFAMHIQLAVL